MKNIESDRPSLDDPNQRITAESSSSIIKQDIESLSLAKEIDIRRVAESPLDYSNKQLLDYALKQLPEISDENIYGHLYDGLIKFLQVLIQTYRTVQKPPEERLAHYLHLPKEIRFDAWVETYLKNNPSNKN